MNTVQNNYLEKTIAELVVDDYRKAEFFKRNGIDFCCGGKKKLADVCKSKNMNPQEFVQSLEEFLAHATPQKTPDYTGWDLDFLADYIVNVHHSYVKENLPLLDEFSAKVARVHGDGSPEVVELRQLFLDMANELGPHLYKEEKVLFPYISQMAKFQRSHESGEAPAAAFAKGPILVMESEHDQVGEIVHKMQALTRNFSPPEQACNTWRVLYFKLNEFAEDLFQHIHLENNVLFPAALKLEAELLKITVARAGSPN